MKIKIDHQLLDEKGEAIVEGALPEANLRDVCVGAILTPVKDETQEQKWEKYEIFKKLRDSKIEVDLTIEQLNIVKTCIGKFYPQLIMGQCFELLESGQGKKAKANS
jgi:hypothetical protein